MGPKPSKTARALLKLFCDQAYHEEVEGDLDELFADNYQRLGKRKANWLYWADVFKHFNWFFFTRRRFKLISQKPLDMWSNYFKVAVRNIFKHKGYSALNVMGLGVGMACAMLILLYALHELSYDRFHVNADRIVVAHTKMTGESDESSSAPNAFVPLAIRELPEVETGVRIFNRGSYFPFIVKYKDNVFQEDRLFHTDSTFFKVFSFPLMKGNPQTCLVNPKSIVLTSEMARKYFGEEDPMGKLLRIDNRHDYQVTGVMEDQPQNSHIHFDFLVSWTSFTNSFNLNERWDNASYTSYLLLDENVSATQVEAKIPAIIDRLENPRYTPSFTLHPLTDIHLRGLGGSFGLEAQNELRYLYIFGIIGLLILVIASVNYTNLATARAVHRAREIGMRKVLGAYRFNLFNQFIGESVMVVFMAVVVAILLVMLALPSFNELSGRVFMIADLFQFDLVTSVLLMALLVSTLAGIYPALVLSGFKPLIVLKGSFKSSKGGVFIRRFLVTGQFMISIGLIIGTSVVFNQLDYMQQKELGYNNDNVLMLPLSSSILRNYASFKAEMLKESGVLDLTLTSESPTSLNAGYSIILKDVDVEKEVYVNGVRTDLDFLDAMQIELVAGSFFSELDLKNISRDIEYKDRVFAFVLNEEAVRRFGISPEEAIGKRAHMNGRNGIVRGVVKDFHFASMHEKIQPMSFLPERDFNNVLVRISGQNIENTLSKVQERWRRLAPNVPFEYEFMDDEYNNLYNTEQRLSKLFGTFATLAIFIACFGLFGLIAFVTAQKAREIGVRKVLGASVGQLVLLLNKGFAGLILIAFMLATPVAYLLMSGWLREFEYRTHIGLQPVLLSLLMTVLIAFASTSFQSLRAARANPVDALKEE
ncbi:MAG: FtsX-like permease family protein [Roseivirga sp.]|nr:FtsX-like permease family protein [Roseivirga sp.]